MSVQQVLEKLIVNLSIISPVIKKLSNIDIVSKYRLKNDDRSVSVHLTNKGMRICDKLSLILKWVVYSTNLSEKEFTKLKIDFDSLTLNLTGNLNKNIK